VHLLRRQPDQCPPGTEASKVSWVGTCLNPQDGRQYLVSYNDCCGKASCGECLCNNNERERPGYRLGVFNDINWCMANTSTMFHCTTSVIVGVALMSGVLERRCWPRWRVRRTSVKSVADAAVCRPRPTARRCSRSTAPPATRPTAAARWAWPRR
jgi:hypothetical protein